MVGIGHSSLKRDNGVHDYTSRSVPDMSLKHHLPYSKATLFYYDMFFPIRTGSTCCTTPVLSWMVQRDEWAQLPSLQGGMQVGMGYIGKLKCISFASYSWLHNWKVIDLIAELRSHFQSTCSLLPKSMILISHVTLSSRVHSCASEHIAFSPRNYFS